MLKKHLKRLYRVLFKKEYKSVDERIQDAKYLTRINIVIIVLWLIYLIFAFDVIFRRQNDEALKRTEADDTY